MNEESDLSDTGSQVALNHTILEAGKGKCFDLNLDRDYVEYWTTTDAFRELYQNWKDAIVGTFNLNHRTLKPIKRPMEDPTEFKMVHPGPDGLKCIHGHGHKKGDLLGYIIYDEAKGLLELTNFESSLGPETLRLGRTSKRLDDMNSAGHHGEGFKLATFVMVRNKYQVRAQASEFYWRFLFGGLENHQFFCKMKPMAPTKLVKLKNTASNTQGPRKLESRIWEDVTFQIGNIYGKNTEEQRIPKMIYRKWLTASLDLDTPSESKIVGTKYGDLILDERFFKKIFIKGLLGGKPGQGFKYGYNFFHGEINRDRQRLVDLEEERDVLARIWKDAMSKKESLVSEYVSMLKGKVGSGGSVSWTDVEGAKTRIKKSTAIAIWKFILDDGQKRGVFFHNDKNNERDVRIITHSLGKVPEQLPGVLWEILERYGLVRSPHEEMEHRFRESQDILPPGTAYSRSMHRAFRSVLMMHEKTNSLEVIFKTGDNNGIDVLLREEASQLLVHISWLEFESSHQKSSCPLSREVFSSNFQDLDVFACPHIVLNFFRSVLRQFKGRFDQSFGPDLHSTLLRDAEERINEMPCQVVVEQTSVPGELKISWTKNESPIVTKFIGTTSLTSITLHRVSTCLEKRFEVIYQESNHTELLEDEQNYRPKADCGCPFAFVPQNKRFEVFKGLDTSESYFPMVAGAKQKSFFGMPPSAESPIAVSKAIIIDVEESDGSMETHSPQQVQDTDFFETESSSDTVVLDDGVSSYQPSEVIPTGSHHTQYKTNMPQTLPPTRYDVNTNSRDYNLDVSEDTSRLLDGTVPGVLAELSLTNQSDKVELRTDIEYPDWVSQTITNTIRLSNRAYFRQQEEQQQNSVQREATPSTRDIHMNIPTQASSSSISHNTPTTRTHGPAHRPWKKRRVEVALSDDTQS